jgi:hypothetical protein
MQITSVDKLDFLFAVFICLLSEKKCDA